jgi:alpha-L-arabinofuranosidase
VQQLFSQNMGDYYLSNVISKNNSDSLLAASCVFQNSSGEIIIKLVNAGKETKTVTVNTASFKKIMPLATVTTLSGSAGAENTFENPNAVTPVTTTFNVSKKFSYSVQPMSLTVIKIKTK